MRTNLKLIAVALLALLGCSEDNLDPNKVKDDKSITSLNGTWKVISFEDYKTDKVEFKNHENSWDLDIVITFDDTSDPNALFGTNTTNGVTGEFEYVGDRQFKVLRFGSTFVGQPSWADKFGSAMLDENNSFKINDQTLRIYFDNKTKSVTLERQ